MLSLHSMRIAALVFLAACATTDEAPDIDLDAELDDGKSDTASQLVYLNFGGDRLHGGDCSDAPSNCSNQIVGTQDLAPFIVSDQWDRVKVVAAITSCVGQFYSDMKVSFVTTRPAGGDYSMMMIGAMRASQIGFPDGQGPYGRASVDCGNRNKRDIGFLLETDPNPDFYFMCRSIAHELGHMFGMVHTKGPNAIHGGRVDMMCESGECAQAAANGSAKWDTLNTKMESQVEACDGSDQQNTYARLMETLGVRTH